MNPDDSREPRGGDRLDEALDETFPASDAPANTVETGIRLGEVASARNDVSDNPARSRFELTVDGQTAFLDYERSHGSLKLIHAEVPPSLRGRHLGGDLVEFALQSAHADGLRVVAICPFVRAYMRKKSARRGGDSHGSGRGIS